MNPNNATLFLKKKIDNEYHHNYQNQVVIKSPLEDNDE